MNENLKKKISEEFDERLENILRGLVIKGYEMGKKQSNTPFEYTCDTDIAKKEWSKIKSFLFSTIEEVLEGKAKEIKERIPAIKTHPCNCCSNPDEMADKRCPNCYYGDGFNKAFQKAIEIIKK